MDKQKIIIHNTHSSSEKLGLCEICNKHASEVHNMYIKAYDNEYNFWYHQKISLWGHKSCLENLKTRTNAELLELQEEINKRYYGGTNV